MSETWRPIPGYRRYEVSTLGNVRNVETGHALTVRRGKVAMRNPQGNYQNHRVMLLVALAFSPSPHPARTDGEKK